MIPLNSGAPTFGLRLCRICLQFRTSTRLDLMTSPLVPSGFPREKVGLCMIVKNEARALGRCLESAKDWVGEMVVVDTGSTDETVAIAQSHGARVSYFPWCDDFSAARNAALDQATREWVLVLD